MKYLDVKSRIGGLMLFLCIGSGHAQNDHVVVSFDALVTKSLYETALDTAMRVWGDLGALSKTERRVLVEERTELLDSSVGRLFYLDWCLERILDDSERYHIDSDDAHYLISIVSDIHRSLHNLLKKYADERVGSLNRVLTTMEPKLAKVISTYIE